jgi:hypothetical protein
MPGALLEIVVLDENPAHALHLLGVEGLELAKGSDSLAVCREGLRRSLQSTQDRLSVKYNDRGPIFELT